MGVGGVGGSGWWNASQWQSTLAGLGDANDPTLAFADPATWASWGLAPYDAGSGGGGWGAVAALIAPLEGGFASEQSFIDSLPGMGYANGMSPFLGFSYF